MTIKLIRRGAARSKQIPEFYLGTRPTSVGRKATAIDQSLRPSDFAPAFGRAVAASRRLFYGTPEGVPFRFGSAMD